ncbi:MAG TPA: cytochrome c biogenesis CcdA family protein [Streptosporangiaceae bacterium]|nr:cytochrome c biogenesis CcdA family protein [Streptosporangiaceae bacterium]
MSVGNLVTTGPLLLAIPVAAAAGAVTFLSPCVLPLVPGYLSYITGMSGDAAARAARTGQTASDGADNLEAVGNDSTAHDSTAHHSTGHDRTGHDSTGHDSTVSNSVGGVATATTLATGQFALTGPSKSRVMAGAALFVAGFSVLFGIEGIVVGGIGGTLRAHEAGLARLLGVVLILLGLLFAGAFDRFGFAGRIIKPSFRPRAGLTTAPLLGMLFGLGWIPCVGPTLGAVLTLGLSTGTAARGGLLAFVYALGIGVPFLIVALAFQRGVTSFNFARRHARRISQIGGLLLIIVGLLEVSGVWGSAVTWLKLHWLASYNPPI